MLHEATEMPMVMGIAATTAAMAIALMSIGDTGTV